MRTYEAGRESSILQDICAGTKTIEARLARGKFLDFQPGDAVRLREDFYEAGSIAYSIPDRAKTTVVKTEHYDSFAGLLKAVGYKNVLPRSASLADATSQCLAFYSTEEEAQYGVIALYFRLSGSSDYAAVVF